MRRRALGGGAVRAVGAVLQEVSQEARPQQGALQFLLVPQRRVLAEQLMVLLLHLRNAVGAVETALALLFREQCISRARQRCNV